MFEFLTYDASLFILRVRINCADTCDIISRGSEAYSEDSIIIRELGPYLYHHWTYIIMYTHKHGYLLNYFILLAFDNEVHIYMLTHMC